MRVPDAPTTPDEAVDFLRWCVTHIGRGFHPDTSARMYVTNGREPTFTAEEAHRLDAGLDAVFALLDDPYIYTLSLHDPNNSNPTED